MRNLRTLILLVVVAAWLPTSSARADTGQLREVAEGDGLRAVVFTAPTPLRAGIVEVAVLVTDSATGAPLDQAEVDVSYRHVDWDPDTPSMVIGGGPDPGDAFVRKAILELHEEGSWALLVEVRSEGRLLEIPIDVSAGAPMPTWWQILPIALSGVPFLLLVVVRDRLSMTRLRAQRGLAGDVIDAQRPRRRG